MLSNKLVFSESVNLLNVLHFKLCISWQVVYRSFFFFLVIVIALTDCPCFEVTVLLANVSPPFKKDTILLASPRHFLLASALARGKGNLPTFLLGADNKDFAPLSHSPLFDPLAVDTIKSYLLYIANVNLISHRIYISLSSFLHLTFLKCEVAAALF